MRYTLADNNDQRWFVLLWPGGLRVIFLLKAFLKGMMGLTRILSYNILVGATRRIDPLTGMIKAARPDIVGLVEATNPQVVEELARRLDMQHVLSGYSQALAGLAGGRTQSPADNLYKDTFTGKTSS